jgi:DNA (cytosine-5)-methyltransferase 1
MTAPLVLSLFPGIGLLDMAFEEQGFCVVRGPDLLWGGDIRRFHPPAGRFDGVIGGPPCQAFSRAAARARNGDQELAENLIPEFVRVVELAQPEWWLCENVIEAPRPAVDGYRAHRLEFDNRQAGGEQRRARAFTFGGRGEPRLLPRVALEHPVCAPTVTGNGTKWDPVKKRSYSDRSATNLREAIRLQGLPADFSLPSFTIASAMKAVGNGVPLPMGRAIAEAVSRAVGGPQ